MNLDRTPPPAHPETALQVVATAGHVDHGKSALILRLTGMDPDRLREEKRRGLTIDLGFAWTALPSGREVGFVDVPGHERFIRNMLAGVGPVRLVLFVVAADEGWKPQSEEHLQILDVLGAEGAVVALTKRDLADPALLDRRVQEVRARLEGTRLEQAPIVPVSSASGEGLDELRGELDSMLAAAPAPESAGRARQFIDRVFTIRGSGTVVTGTLTGGPLAVGQEAEILPTGLRARIRGLQTHKRSLQAARPVSRVAVNLAGAARGELERGDALTVAGQWRATSSFDARVRTVRGLDHPLSSRGAYKVHVGAAERDARVRFLGSGELRPGSKAFARIVMSRAVVLEVGDAFVLREAGRRETVGGGEVLDTDPPGRPSRDPVARLSARIGVDRPTLAWRIVAERGAIRARDLRQLTGVVGADVVSMGAVPLDGWLLGPEVVSRAWAALTEQLRAFHAAHPLLAGMEIAAARGVLAGILPAFDDQALADALIGHLAARGALTRTGTIVRLPEHSASTAGREDADRLVRAVASGEPTPPSVRELVAAGFPLELIGATCSDGRLVRISADLVFTPEFVSRTEALVRKMGASPGFTVSAFREQLGTSRRYALPILEHLDARGLTRRQGDVRVLRG